MISDEEARQAYLESKKILDRHARKGMLATQLYRGSRGPRHWENNHPGACRRHMSVFKRFNVIPRFCFDCYKVVIAPRDVVELFKLVVLYDKYPLPNDNVRKCMVEGRPDVPGTYKGLIYCQGLADGKRILALYHGLLRDEISGNIPVELKRGCSEYGIAYPDYKRLADDPQSMVYREEWKAVEEQADREQVFQTPPVKPPSPGGPQFALRDAEAMLAWLKYAATIGDPSYLRISGVEVQPYDNLVRPTPFTPT